MIIIFGNYNDTKGFVKSFLQAGPDAKTRCSTFQDRKGAASRFYMGERKEWQAERSFGAQVAKDLDEIRITGSGSQLFQCFVVAAYAGKVGEDVGKSDRSLLETQIMK